MDRPARSGQKVTPGGSVLGFSARRARSQSGYSTVSRSHTISQIEATRGVAKPLGFSFQRNRMRRAASNPYMDPLEYSFGTGAEAPATWNSPADLDLGPLGGMDAVRLDFDGDGLLDDAMWDDNGDGAGDHSVLDYDAGNEARYFTDPSGNGTWDREVRVAGDHIEPAYDLRRHLDPVPDRRNDEPSDPSVRAVASDPIPGAVTAGALSLAVRGGTRPRRRH